jgi:Integrase core domain
MDLFVAPTIGFNLLYGFIVVRLARRHLVWVAVTTNPTAEWIARQISEAFPWTEAPRYLIRDRDRVYGTMVTRRVRAMGIRDKPIACGSPRQNCFAERLIGSIRQECLDHFVILGEAHLRRILGAYSAYYNVSSWKYPFPRDPWRTASPLCPRLSFRYTHRTSQEPGPLSPLYLSRAFEIAVFARVRH